MSSEGDNETPEQRSERRRSRPQGERLATLEAEVDALEDQNRQIRRNHDRLEARLWLIVTAATGIGSAGGAVLANLFGG